MRVVQTIVELGHVQHTCQFMIGSDGKLMGVAGIDILKEWLGTQVDSDPKNVPTTTLGSNPSPSQVQLNEAAKKNIKFFGSAPCWFEGCDELRAQYQSELDALQNRTTGCKPCEKGALMRKFLLLLEQAQNEKPVETNDPG